MPDSMIERVARAIATAQGENFDDAFDTGQEWLAARGYKNGRYVDSGAPLRGQWIDVARAAVEAFREPTVAMWSAGFNVDIRNPLDVWQAMVDTILAEGQPAGAAPVTEGGHG